MNSCGNVLVNSCDAAAAWGAVELGWALSAAQRANVKCQGGTGHPGLSSHIPARFLPGELQQAELNKLWIYFIWGFSLNCISSVWMKILWKFRFWYGWWLKKKNKNIQNKGLIFWKNSKMTKLCVRILFFIYLPPSTTWNGLAFYFPPSGTWTQPFHSYVIYCYTFSQKWKLEINHWQEHTPTCNQSAESKINLYSSILINILHIWINIANKFAHSFSKLTDD